MIRNDLIKTMPTDVGFIEFAKKQFHQYVNDKTLTMFNTFSIFDKKR